MFWVEVMFSSILTIIIEDIDACQFEIDIFSPHIFFGIAGRLWLVGKPMIRGATGTFLAAILNFFEGRYINDLVIKPVNQTLLVAPIVIAFTL